MVAKECQNISIYLDDSGIFRTTQDIIILINYQSPKALHKYTVFNDISLP